MTRGSMVVFAGYSGFLRHLQLAGHDSRNMAEKVKIEIPNSI